MRLGRMLVFIFCATTFLAAQDRGFPTPAPAPAASRGSYHALVIGIDHYEKIKPPLATAVNDAAEVAKVLTWNYGFETKLLVDGEATRAAIVDAIYAYRPTLTERDSLLIYFAGHGAYEREADKAYWLPVDADKDSPANWIMADDITTALTLIPAKHVLVISDSCYSGGITRDFDTRVRPEERSRYLQKIAAGKSRNLMSSGGVEPVADSGRDNHSVFASAVLRGFSQIDDGEFSAEDFFYRYVKLSVAGQSSQVPQYNIIRHSGHDDGDFVFVRRTAPAARVMKDHPASGSVASPLPTTGSKLSPKDGLTYIWIPPGSFLMGCSPGDPECFVDELPANHVVLSKGFWLGQTEVTQEAYVKVTGKNPSVFRGTNLPVENVNWWDALGYCTAVGMRLPTEAEWEYAARAGTTGPRYGNLDEIAWYKGNSSGHSHEVASKQPNAFGLFDMLGNVWEWTADWSGAEYRARLIGMAGRAGNVDPKGAPSGTARVVRGGTWDNDARSERVSTRGADETGVRGAFLGFRCAGD